MTGARPRRPVIGVMGSGVERHDTLAGAVGTEPSVYPKNRINSTSAEWLFEQ